MNVLEEAYLTAVGFIQTYGWRIVALAVAYYWISPYLTEGWQKVKDMDPREVRRKALLDKEMRRARREQQAKLSTEQA